jgi:hypothetical protein
MIDNILDRFFAKVKFGPGDCWYWQGFLEKLTGYGKFFIKSPYKKIGAHVFSYEFHKKIEVKHELHHTCKHPNCVNPDHLVDLTREKHMQAHSTGFCERGHEMTPKNTRISISGKHCKKCATINQRNYRKRTTWIKNV